MEAQVESPAQGVNYLRPKRVAKMADVSLTTIYASLYSGDLKGLLFKGRIWLIREEDVEDWIQRNSQPNTKVA